MAHGWWLPEETWCSMSDEQQRQHRVGVRAYFLSQQRAKDGTPGTPEDDWLAAEQEESRGDEVYQIYRKYCDATDRNERIRYFILYLISEAMKLRPADINRETSLPADSEARQTLGRSLGWQLLNDVYRIPDHVATVGALIEALNNETRVVRPRRCVALG